jgi:hypothetical protein
MASFGHGGFRQDAPQKFARIAGLDRLDLFPVAEHFDRHSGLRLEL